MTQIKYFPRETTALVERLRSQQNSSDVKASFLPAGYSQQHLGKRLVYPGLLSTLSHFLYESLFAPRVGFTKNFASNSRLTYHSKTASKITTALLRVDGL